MALNTVAKAQVIKEFGRDKTDTGSPEVQIALLTSRISELTEHLKTHKHDVHSRYGLTKLVSQRRRLLRYLKTKNSKVYYQLIEKLDIRG